MSEKTSEATPVDKEKEALIAFVNEEIKRTRRGVSLTYTYGIVASVIIAIYMGWVLMQINTALEPSMLSGLTAEFAKDNIPQFIEESKNSLLERAPKDADNISKQFLNLVPQYREEGEQLLDRTHQEMVPFISQEMQTYIKTYVDTNADALKQFAEENENEGYAAVFVESMIEELDTQLNRHLALEYEGRSLDYFHENLTLSLLAMDETLDELVNADVADMDRRQLLRRRLLARLFVSALDASQ